MQTTDGGGHAMVPQGRHGRHRRAPLKTLLYAVALISLGGAMFSLAAVSKTPRAQRTTTSKAARDSQALFRQGRQIFRHDTFGDEAFWGGVLQLHKAVEGAAHGGV